MEIHIQDMKPEAQIRTLKDLCKQISEIPDASLAPNAESLLTAIVEVLDEQSQDDAWGTEGWQHYFGYE
jgi:hypothetical protein